MLDTEKLLEIGRNAVSHGIGLAVHAIGDRANREVLNAYAQLREYEGSIQFPSKNWLRHRIEHVQVIHPDDIHRFSELNIIASMQPIHATSDMLMAEIAIGAIDQLTLTPGKHS
jgi:predicted amidohydrolase YtcJ